MSSRWPRSSRVSRSGTTASCGLCRRGRVLWVLPLWAAVVAACSRVLAAQARLQHLSGAAAAEQQGAAQAAAHAAAHAEARAASRLHAADARMAELVAEVNATRAELAAAESRVGALGATLERRDAEIAAAEGEIRSRADLGDRPGAEVAAARRAAEESTARASQLESQALARSEALVRLADEGRRGGARGPAQWVPARQHHEAALELRMLSERHVALGRAHAGLQQQLGAAEAEIGRLRGEIRGAQQAQQRMARRQQALGGGEGGGEGGEGLWTSLQSRVKGTLSELGTFASDLGGLSAATAESADDGTWTP